MTRASKALVVAVLLVAPSARATPNAVCTGDEIITLEACGDPCNVNGDYSVADGCILNFGSRDVNFNGTISFEGPFAGNGIEIITFGDFLLGANGQISGSTSDDGGGFLFMQLGGSLRIEGDINLNASGPNGNGGELEIVVDGDIISTEGSTINGESGDEADFGAEFFVEAGNNVDLNGLVNLTGQQGILGITSGGFTNVPPITGDGKGDGAPAAELVIESSDSITFNYDIHLNGSDNGRGGTIFAETLNDITINADLSTNGGASADGGDMDFSGNNITIHQVEIQNSGGDFSFGGRFNFDAGSGITIVDAMIDGSGGNGGGEFEATALGNINVSGRLDVRGDGGGVIVFNSNEGGITISGQLNARGMGGSGGGIFANGCRFEMTSSAEGNAGGFNGGSISFESSSSFTMEGVLNALAADPPAGTQQGDANLLASGLAAGTGADGTITFTFPSIFPPSLTGVVNPMPILRDLPFCSDEITTDCVRRCAARCGDGVLDPSEQCDDGNNVDCDGCSALCLEEPAPCPPTNTPTPTASGTPTPTSPAAATGTPTWSPTCTPTSTPIVIGPTGTATLTPTQQNTSTPTEPSAGVCGGDCNGDLAVTVDEIVVGLNIALAIRPIEDCPRFDTSGDDQVTVDEIVGGVNNALNGCPA